MAPTSSWSPSQCSSWACSPPIFSGRFPSPTLRSYWWVPHERKQEYKRVLLFSLPFWLIDGFAGVQIFGLGLGFMHKGLSKEKSDLQDGKIDEGGELPRRLLEVNAPITSFIWEKGYEKLGSGIQLWSVSGCGSCRWGIRPRGCRMKADLVWGFLCRGLGLSCC